VKVTIAVLSAALTFVVAAASIAAPSAPTSSSSETGASPSPAPTAKLSKWQRAQLEMYDESAPDDEYFGKMKMSYLGMNNTFRDASISSGDHTTNPAIVNKVAFAEDALEAWAAKYPHDPQLARTYFLATVVERKIWLKQNQEHAWIYLNRVVQLFPDTYFGKLLKADLKIGFTEHYYANSEACPAAPPTPAPVDEGVDAYFAPPPLAAAATPAPTPTPLPSVTPVALATGLRVEVLPQPCVPSLATPAPTPSP